MKNSYPVKTIVNWSGIRHSLVLASFRGTRGGKTCEYLIHQRFYWQRAVYIQYTVVLYSTNITFNMYSHCSYCISSRFNWSPPPLKGGILRVVPKGKISGMWNPLSGIILPPGSSFSGKPKHFALSLSEAWPVQRDELKLQQMFSKCYGVYN